MQERTIVFVLK